MERSSIINARAQVFFYLPISPTEQLNYTVIRICSFQQITLEENLSFLLYADVILDVFLNNYKYYLQINWIYGTIIYLQR